jgi:hypothetical protein
MARETGNSMRQQQTMRKAGKNIRSSCVVRRSSCKMIIFAVTGYHGEKRSMKE